MTGAHKMFDADCLKVLAVSGASLGAGLAEFDVLLKVGVSLLTVLYLAFKIYRLLRPDRSDDEP